MTIERITAGCNVYIVNPHTGEESLLTHDDVDHLRDSYGTLRLAIVAGDRLLYDVDHISPVPPSNSDTHIENVFDEPTKGLFNE